MCRFVVYLLCGFGFKPFCLLFSSNLICGSGVCCFLFCCGYSHLKLWWFVYDLLLTLCWAFGLCCLCLRWSFGFACTWFAWVLPSGFGSAVCLLRGCLFSGSDVWGCDFDLGVWVGGVLFVDWFCGFGFSGFVISIAFGFVLDVCCGLQ